MLRIVCVQQGNYCGRGAEYVNVLFDSVRRNVKAGTPGEFVCFTDRSEGLAAGILIRPLPHPGLKGWWNKLALFKPGLFPVGDRIVYLDLDTLVVGALDDLLAWDGEFAALDDFYRQGGVQSAVMSWRAGYGAHLWQLYAEAGFPQYDPRGDQWWIESHDSAVTRLQTAFPRSFVSYKLHCRPYPPRGAKVVCFHGNPRPHEIVSGWVADVWKVGGSGAVELDMICNTEMAQLRSNVQGAMQRGLPEFRPGVEGEGKAVCIVGGGPSVREFLPEILARAQAGARVWALNGAGKWLVREAGFMPDAVWIVDARPENAAFVLSNTLTIVASQCHPDVFDALGRCLVFHDLGCQEVLPPGVLMVGGGSTVGMKALAGAYMVGHRRIYLYGMDSSVSGGSHHAYGQAQNDGDLLLEVVVGEERFSAAPWMVQQAMDFQTLALHLAQEGCEIHVRSLGLIQAMAQALGDVAVSEGAAERADAILRRLPAGGVEGVEVGVFCGDLSRKLLAARSDLRLVMVDSWGDYEESFRQSADFHSHLPPAVQERAYARALEAVRFAGERAEVVRKRSRQAATVVPQASKDFVFIDADHTYEGCRGDIGAWLPAVKPGGLLCGHDYRNLDIPFPGVDRAVDEFVAGTGWPLELGENYTWFVRRPEYE